MRERFCQLLRQTNRENIEYVIEDLDAWGFFTAPASVRNHFNFAGGLLAHSLNVYDAAMAIRGAMIPLRPELEKQLPEDSVAIAALLHDVCKSSIYKLVTRRRKSEIGTWEDVQSYEVDYSDLPVGHGEKSVIMLLRSGLDLEDAEICAIRWHMSPWDMPMQSIEMDKNLRTAQRQSPLTSLIHAADSLAAHMLEMDATAV